MLWHTDRALFKRLSASNPIMIPLTSWPVSSNSSCTYPIYLWICPMTISEARPLFSSITRIVFLFLLMARMSMGPVSDGYCCPTSSPSSSNMSYFFPISNCFQFFTMKSSKCFSSANSEASSISGDDATTVAGAVALINFSISSA